MQWRPALGRFDSSTRLAMWVAAISAPVAGAHAQPQGTGEVEVTGYVAPRCWVADLSVQSMASPLILRGRAICNHGMPLLRSSVRLLDIDGRIDDPMPSAALTQAADSQSSRTALQIVVSPQI